MGQTKEEITMWNLADLIQYAYQQYEHVRYMFDYEYRSQCKAYQKYRFQLENTLKEYQVPYKNGVSRQIGELIVDHSLRDYFMGNEENDLKEMAEKSFSKDEFLTEIQKKLMYLDIEEKSIEQSTALYVEKFRENFKAEYEKYFIECKEQRIQKIQKEYDELGIECYVVICAEIYNERFLKEKARHFRKRCREECRSYYQSKRFDMSAKQCVNICAEEYQKDYQKVYEKDCPEENRKKFFEECLKEYGRTGKRKGKEATEEIDEKEVDNCVNLCYETYKKEFLKEYLEEYLGGKSRQYIKRCKKSCQEKLEKESKKINLKNCLEICAEEYWKDYQEAFGKDSSNVHQKRFLNECKERCAAGYDKIIASHAIFDEDGIAKSYYEYHLPLISEEDWTTQLTDQIIDRTMLRSIFHMFFTFQEEEFRKDLQRRAKCIDSSGEFLPGYYELTRKLENPLGCYIFMNEDMKALIKDIQKLKRDIQKLKKDIQKPDEDE